MTDTPIIRAARALARHESGTDCYDGLDEAQQQTLQESVRVVLEQGDATAWLRAADWLDANGFELAASALTRKAKEQAALSE